MREELTNLQPQLIKTSRETEELIAIIEKETIEVESVKKVVEADEAVANKAAMEAQSIKVLWYFCLFLFSRVLYDQLNQLLGF